MNKLVLSPNAFLKRPTPAYYSLDYVGYDNPGNPDFLNHLKNQFASCSWDLLLKAYQEACNVLRGDLPQIPRLLKLPVMTVCVVPRAKAENYYSSNQRLFRAAVQSVVADCSPVLEDGTDFIQRHTNTRTTHMKKHDSDGEMPYPGITRDTCELSNRIAGKDILLVDDIYTATVNVDEDAIQALYDVGAKSVALYAVARTIPRWWR
ncbi:MAG: hypothetical protein KatS3mg015_0959 [Fimbriimonadales bacterium]|nr:MAG: hypothetical protein KatS3mg015_0959 [Fimbriimonadales bacterium]